MGENEQGGMLRTVVVVGLVAIIAAVMIFGVVGLKSNMTKNTDSAVAVGTNLLTGTAKWQGEWGRLSLWPMDKEEYKGLAVRHRSAAWYGLGQYYDATPNTTYTFSFYAKASDAGNIMDILTLDVEDWHSPVVSIPIFANQAVTTEWQRYSVTFTTNSGGKIFPSVCSTRDNKTIYVAGYQLEKGDIATPWRPNPADQIASN